MFFYKRSKDSQDLWNQKINCKGQWSDLERYKWTRGDAYSPPGGVKSSPSPHVICQNLSVSASSTGFISHSRCISSWVSWGFTPHCPYSGTQASKQPPVGYCPLLWLTNKDSVARGALAHRGFCPEGRPVTSVHSHWPHKSRGHI